MKNKQEPVTVFRKVDNLKPMASHATESKRQETFARLAEHVSTLADEFARAIEKTAATGKSPLAGPGVATYSRQEVPGR